MKRIYSLKTCDKCNRMLSEFVDKQSFEIIDIKSVGYTAAELEEMKSLAGSYSALFSKVAKKYKERKLSERKLTEEDFKTFLLSDYTFLKRPVKIDGQEITVGKL
jgi:arsenate reductase-like glutaredoxin family protein